MKPLFVAGAGLLLALTTGCAAVPSDAPVVTPAGLTAELVERGPFWIEFAEGETLPVYVRVEGPLFEMKPPAPLEVKVKKRFYLLVGDGPPRLSEDRQTWAPRGGRFGFHLANTEEKGPHATVTVEMGEDLPPPGTK